MGDRIFEHPRLAAIYDALDSDRSDLAVYLAIAAELKTTRVLDIGCGTGTFGLLLAERGFEVSGSTPPSPRWRLREVKPAPSASAGSMVMRRGCRRLRSTSSR